ncbi:hypothetical protein [Nocardioides zeae]|uniref:Uncharacterized protein n=1 Tax=Nocardioides zeae TaxID=1457234 RepID=A0A6P0HK33_9ACTN|nr:hypothetical protein [Nocardioides zeae]NEN78946.1 hypothetical protein [Nocardioides zeae]
MSTEKSPAEELRTEDPTTEPTLEGDAREAEAGQPVAGAEEEPDGGDDPTPAAADVAPTTDAPDAAAALEESGGEHIIEARQD